MPNENIDPPFGVFAPRGLAGILISASRNTFFGRGEPRKVIWNALRTMRQPCFDVVANGVRMRLFPFDSSLERSLLLRPRKVYPKELAFLRKALESAGTLVDAGANVGAMSLPLADRPRIRIVAVEPGPTALTRLRSNIAANGFVNVRVDDAALSGVNGTTRFFVDDGDTKLSGIGASGATGAEIEVPTKTFATLLADHGIRGPYVLKIDIERHEDQVLMPFFESASRDAWPRHVLIETIERAGIPECVSFMLSNGYQKVFATPQNTGLSLT